MVTAEAYLREVEFSQVRSNTTYINISLAAYYSCESRDIAGQPDTLPFSFPSSLENQRVLCNFIQYFIHHNGVCTWIRSHLITLVIVLWLSE